MAHHPFDVQLDWDADAVAMRWADRPDNRFFLRRLHEVTVEAVREGGAHRLPVQRRGTRA